MIKCMDNQVVPAELEELILKEHSDFISDVVIVGLPSAQHGEAPAAVIVLKDHSGSKCDTENLAKKIKATVADNLAVHKHLYGGVFFFDSLPKTDTGKVTRSALVQACTTFSSTRPSTAWRSNVLTQVAFSARKPKTKRRFPAGASRVLESAGISLTSNICSGPYVVVRTRDSIVAPGARLLG
ncbi:hypothetical protein V5799_008636 [Amblyomma americanum]|uniref:AMP-binding enzyme C-terminal domain-containing protein n=1 Tax=Amblyomma americanum TaxID=6943 RepID=A0AAQ4FED6_AMBAM